MCLPLRRLDRKTRRIYAAGNFCLISWWILTYFGGSFGHLHHAIFNCLRFLFVGCAIGLLFWFARRRHCANDPRL